MGKRCIESGCPYLATDGTCLLKVWELPEKCPCREQCHHPEKDSWMDSVFCHRATVKTETISDGEL